MEKEDATPEVPVFVAGDKQLKGDAEMTNQELPDGVKEKFAIWLDDQFKMIDRDENLVPLHKVRQLQIKPIV